MSDEELLSKQEVVNVMFTYHTPTTEQVQQMQEIRSKAKELATLIVKYVPDNYYISENFDAIKSLSDAVMKANAGIVRDYSNKD